jgi:hypothetical protein
MLWQLVIGYNLRDLEVRDQFEKQLEKQLEPAGDDDPGDPRA